MKLRESIARAAHGEGGFAVEEGGARRTLPRGDFRTAARRMVLWPLTNSAASIGAFLSAIADGVVPIVIPAGWPPGRVAAMRSAFPGIGAYDRGTIDLPADATPADPRAGLALLTSGSTGAPRAIVTSLDALELGVAAIAESQGLDAVTSTGVMLPLAYSYALVNQLLWAVHNERRLVLTAGMALPAEALRQLRSARAEMVCLVAHQARLLVLKHGFGAESACPDVRVLNFAGALFPAAALPGLRALFPAAAVVNNYGCAEAMPRLAAGPVAGDHADATVVGPPVRGVEVRIEPGGGTGPITFRAPSASLGTLGPDGSLQPHPAWIPSGDQGRMENGVLRVLGRHDQVVKVFGERISTVEIEDALRAAGATEALAWVTDDGSGGDLVRAVVSAATPPAADALTNALAARLPRTLWPRDVRFIPEWPTLDNGKTDALKLKQAEDLTRIL